MSLKPIDDKICNGIAKETNYAVVSKGNTSSDKEISIFEARGIPTWPKTVRNAEDLEEQMQRIKKLSPVAAGDAELIYQTVLQIKGKEYDLTAWTRAATTKPIGTVITRSEVLGANLTEVGGKIKPIIDVELFKKEINGLVAKVDRLEIMKKVAKNSAEQDFWELVALMLEVEETYDLMGLISAKMLLGKEDQAALDLHLSKVTILQNKQGKLSVGLVRLIGYTGLACVKGEPELARAMKFIKNPLLGEDVEQQPLRQKPLEDDVAFKSRKEKSALQFATYKEIMVQMKEHKKHFDALPADKKAKIKMCVRRYTIEG